jgi:hypothetical protein
VKDARMQLRFSRSCSVTRGQAHISAVSAKSRFRFLHERTYGALS